MGRKRIREGGREGGREGREEGREGGEGEEGGEGGKGEEGRRGREGRGGEEREGGNMRGGRERREENEKTSTTRELKLQSRLDHTHQPHPPISPGTRQHLVDAQDVKRVDTDPHVKLVLSTVLDEVLVGTDASCLQRFTGQLLVLVRDHVHTEWKVFYADFFGAEVVYSDLGI